MDRSTFGIQVADKGYLIHSRESVCFFPTDARALDMRSEESLLIHCIKKWIGAVR